MVSRARALPHLQGRRDEEPQRQAPAALKSWSRRIAGTISAAPLRFPTRSAKVPADFQPDVLVRTRIKPNPAATAAPAATPAAHPDLLDGMVEAAASAPDVKSSRPSAVNIGELKFAQLGIAQLTLRTLDPAALHAGLQAKIEAAPQLFTHAPLVLDFGALDSVPTPTAVNALFDAARAAGMLPIGLAHGSAELDQLARTLELPLFARFRPQTEVSAPSLTVPPASQETKATAAAVPVAMPTSAPAPAKAAPATRAAATAIASPTTVINAVGMLHAEPVRSGQQVYARGSDLTLTAMVGNGAEVIADGSIHVYGVLRGRALAGASGNGKARIFCQNFQAELISIAGQYRVFEDIPAELRGKSVQAWLEGDKLLLAPLA